MSSPSHTPQNLLPALILAATLAFALGIVLERSVTGESHTETAVQASAGTSSGSGEGASGETAAQRSAESGEGASAAELASTQPTATHTEAGEQRILGINPESNGPVFAAIAVSLALAAGAWRSRAGVLMAGIVVFGLLFAAFDIRDVIFQARQSRFGLVALAAIVALLHLGASALAARNLRANPVPLRS